ncbi:MAG: Na(+)/H(+) antiporter subunit D [Pseudomonadota bacterium]
MSEFAVSPGLILMAAALAMLILPRDDRGIALLGGPLAVLTYLWVLWLGADGDQVVTAATYLGTELTPLRIDRLSLIFSTVFCLAAFAGGLFALRHDNTKELVAAYLYGGSAIGAVTAGDLLTLFIYWELMAIASALVIWLGGEGARSAGLRYAVIHFLGGVLLMAGAAAHILETGSAAFVAMEAGSVATSLILAAFLINAAAPPLSAWLPDAYPKASWAGMVFLSAFTTKTAVYTLIRGFPGEELLLWIGIAMMIYGIVYALREMDMRRILAYAIVNQVGFMVVAIGIGTPMALDGAAAQSFVHILYKALLIMTAGAVLHQTGTARLDALGGLARAMPVTTACCVVAAATAMAVPVLTVGYASKALIASAAGYKELLVVWLAITIAAAGTALNAGLRYPWFVFFRPRETAIDASDPPMPMRAAMVVLAVLCVALGPLYGLIYEMLPYGTEYAPYKLGSLVVQFEMLLAAVLGFYLVRHWLTPSERGVIDVDWLWRRPGRVIVNALHRAWMASYAGLSDGFLSGLGRMMEKLYRTHGPDSMMARTRPSGYMALWMTVLLCGFMVFAFV